MADRQVLGALLVLGLLVCLVGAEQLDIEQTSTDKRLGLTKNNDLAMIFTPTITGNVTKIYLKGARNNGLGSWENLVVQIRPVDAESHFPTDDILATKTVTYSDFPSGNLVLTCPAEAEWVEVDFSSSLAEVSEDVEYAIVIYRSTRSDTSTEYMICYEDEDDPYSGGNVAERGAAAWTWSASSNDDLAFKVYLEKTRENIVAASQTTADTTVAVYVDNWYSQIFRMDETADLSRMSFHVKKIGTPAGNLNFEIQEVTSGKPNGNFIASGLPVLPGDVDTTSAWEVSRLGVTEKDSLATSSTPPAQAGGLGILTNSKYAQAFTPGRTGNLTKVRLTVTHKATHCEFPLNVSIWNADSDGMPTGSVLAYTSMDDADVPDYSSSGFTEFDVEFDPPPTVRGGHLYALVLEAESCDGDHYYRWHSACGFSTSSCYTRGSKSVNTGSGWSQDANKDFMNPHFIVYIGNNLTQLSTGVDYALVAYSPLSADSSNGYLISKADSNAYSDGTYVGSTDGGSVWTADSDKDMTFRIYRQFLLVPQDDTIQGELPTALEGSTSSNDAVCIFSSAADTPCNSTATSKCHSDAIGYVTEPAENGSGNDYSVTIDESSNGIYHIYYCDGGTEALHIIETHTSKEANTVTVNVAAVKGEAHSELETAGAVDVFEDLAATSQVDTATQSITSSGGDDYAAYFRSNATDGKYYLRTKSTVSTKDYYGYVFFTSDNGTTTTVNLTILAYGQVPTALASGSVWMDDEADETDDTLYRGAITNTGSGYKYRFYHDGTTPMYLKADTDATHASPVLEEQKTVSSDTEWNVAVLTGSVPSSLVGDTIEVHPGTGDSCGGGTIHNSATVTSGGSYGTYSVYLTPDASARYLYACESSTKVYYGSATIDDAGESVSFNIQGIKG
ncbi:MAG: hypothetical protein QGG50_07090, partial [Methanopyri archaeon]|nr:hypothetical protein [Methanopyri archaeon]